MQNIQECDRCHTFISMQTVVRALPDEKNPLRRTNRDGTIIKLDVNNKVYTMDRLIGLDVTGSVFSWQGSEWPNRFRQACTTGSSVEK